MKNYIKNSRGILTLSAFQVFIFLGIALSFSACGGGNGSPEGSTIKLPTDTTLNLYCADEGIGTNTCVLDDPENPYADSYIDNVNKWTLNDASPSAKAKFYLWATAMAHSPQGENQYYTALALHELYTEGRSENAKEQAKLAYRSLLDNYYDALTYYTGNKPLDFLADVDFSFGDFGSGSALNGSYGGDEGFSPVFQVAAGNGWGAPSAALSFEGFTAGAIANYQNLTFKIKNLPTNSVFVKFVSSGAELEKEFDLGTYATSIDSKAGWKDVTIPLSEFPDTDLYTAFAIHAGYSNGGTFLITDIAFTGDTTGNGLVKDYDHDGFVYLYRTNPGTQQYSITLRNLVGKNMTDPNSQNLLQLYYDKSYAIDELTLWGYTYNDTNNTLSKIKQ